MLRFHYSDQADIPVFHPRAPLRHPDSPPRVYSIDPEHRALYFFPRECARVGVWCTPETSPQDAVTLLKVTTKRMLILLDASQAELWHTGHIYEYTFNDDEGWQDTGDHGCWVSEITQTPTLVRLISNLPEAARADGVEVIVVPNLLEAAEHWRAHATLHVSCIRLSTLGGPKGTPVGSPKP